MKFRRFVVPSRFFVSSLALSISAFFLAFIASSDVFAASTYVGQGGAYAYGKSGACAVAYFHTANYNTAYCVQPNLSSPQGTYNYSEWNDTTAKLIMAVGPGGPYYDEFYSYYYSRDPGVSFLGTANIGPTDSSSYGSGLRCYSSRPADSQKIQNLGASQKIEVIIHSVLATYAGYGSYFTCSTQTRLNTIKNDIVAWFNSYSSYKNDVLSNYVAYKTTNMGSYQEVAWLEPKPYNPPTPVVTYNYYSAFITGIVNVDVGGVNKNWGEVEVSSSNPRVQLDYTFALARSSDTIPTPFQVGYSITAARYGGITNYSSNISQNSSTSLPGQSVTVTYGNSTSTNLAGSSLTVAPGESITVCRFLNHYYQYNYTTGSDGSSSGPTASGYVTNPSPNMCITVKGAAAPPPVTVQAATFTANTAVQEASLDSSLWGCSKKSGYSNWLVCNGAVATEKYSVPFLHTITRGSSDSYTESAFAYGSQCKTNSATSGCTGWYAQGNQIGEHLTRGQKATSLVSREVSVAQGGEATLCEAMEYISSYSYEDGVAVSSATAQTTPACITIIRPADSGSTATFRGSTSISTSDSNLSCGSFQNQSIFCTLAASASSYSFNVNHQITRTDSNTAFYNANTSGTLYERVDGQSGVRLTSDSVREVALARNSTTTNYSPARSRSIQELGGTDFYCEYMKYISSRTIYQTSEDSLTANDTDVACIYVTREEDSGETAIFEAQTLISDKDVSLTCDRNTPAANLTCTGLADQSRYSATFLHVISRKDSNTNIYTAPALGKIFQANPNTNALIGSQLGSSLTGNLTIQGVNQTTSINYPLQTNGSSGGIEVAEGSSATYCQRMRYRNTYTEYQIAGSTSSNDNALGSRACITILRPSRLSAEFSARISYEYDPFLTYVSEDSDGTIRLKGDGYHTHYDYEYKYYMRRTDTDQSPQNASSRWALDTERMPSVSALTEPNAGLFEDRASTNEQLVAISGSSSAFNVPVGQTVTVCGHLRYDSLVTYEPTGEVIDRNGAGTVKKCMVIENPAVSITNEFSAQSAVNPDPNLTHVSGTTYEALGIRNYGTHLNEDLSDPSRTIFTNTFNHNLTRDTRNTRNGFFRYDLAYSNWRVQSSTNGSSFNTQIPTSSARTQTGGLASLPENANYTKRVSSPYTHRMAPPYSLNTTTPYGYVSTYCERVNFDKSSTATSMGDNNGVSLSYSGYDGYSSPACITIRNPVIIEFENGETKDPISVTGKTTGALCNGAIVANSRCDAAVLNTRLEFDHQLERSADTYNDTNDIVSVSYSAKETIDGSETATTQSSVAVQLGPSTQFNSSATNGGRTSATLTSSTLKAGQTKEVCHNIKYSPYSWFIRFKDIYRQKTYSDASLNSEPWFVTSRRYSPSPEISSTGYAYGPSPVCVSVYRPWNYNIDTITLDVLPSTSLISSGQVVAPRFNLDVIKDNENLGYITDLNNPEVATISFVLDSVPSNLQNYTRGGLQGGINSKTSLCTFYNSIASNCTVQNPDTIERLTDHVGNDLYNLESYTSVYQAQTVPVPQLGMAQKFCVAIAVRTPSSSSSSDVWRYSAATCLNNSKRPAFHVIGGSTFTNGGIIAALSYGADGNIFGSWDEFAIIARGNVVDTFSGNSIARGKPAADTNNLLCENSPLTILNVSYRSSYCNDGETTLGRATSAVSNNTQLGNLLSDYFSSSTISFSELPDNPILHGTYVVKVDGSLTINRDIILGAGATYSSLNLPQVVIIASGNISISESVTRIDAWLISGGTLNTCAGYSVGSLAGNQCTNALQINGPVTAESVKLLRTANSDPANASTMGAYAERFNYSAAAWLWGAAQSRRINTPNVVHLKKITTRY